MDQPCVAQPPPPFDPNQSNSNDPTAPYQPQPGPPQGREPPTTPYWYPTAPVMPRAEPPKRSKTPLITATGLVNCSAIAE